MSANEKALDRWGRNLTRAEAKGGPLYSRVTPRKFYAAASFSSWTTTVFSNAPCSS